MYGLLTRVFVLVLMEQQASTKTKMVVQVGIWELCAGLVMLLELESRILLTKTIKVVDSICGEFLQRQI